jgi:hypothetical protein
MMLGNQQKKKNYSILLIFSCRLFQVSGNKTTPTADNIYSWVHKEFKENDINATKHRLLCKLDDMSHGKDYLETNDNDLFSFFQ